ncbi:MAG: hypothetical protein OEV07_02490, partial [Gammaproteobacteria bacterium]|nr:hypothetical protein [Gammaproteobacteria bacterium]
SMKPLMDRPFNGKVYFTFQPGVFTQPRPIREAWEAHLSGSFGENRRSNWMNQRRFPTHKRRSISIEAYSQDCCY